MAAIRSGNGAFRAGASEYQGGRRAMEDAFAMRVPLSERRPSSAFFGVFDGHMGDQVSKFLAQTLPERIASLADPTDKDQLTDALLKIDSEVLKTQFVSL